MSYTPENSSSSNQPARAATSDNRKLIYGILGLALILTWGYIIYDKSKSTEERNTLQSQYSSADSSRNAIQTEYNDALARLDSATGSNTELQGALAERKTEIDKLRKQISSITRNKNASAAELARAKSLIKQLNGKIDDMFAEIERLKGENETLTTNNQQLSTEKEQLTTEKTQLQENLATTETAKKDLEGKVDVGSTLHASNLNIAPINVKASGKEKSTSSAKKVDMLRISFDLDENRIATSGSKEIYVSITGPDGAPISSGTFDTRTETGKPYTNKVEVNYEQGKRAPVSFDYKGNGKYQMGDYKIEIYHNGFLIGQGTKSLKKGGLFS
jgi:FtsZ-binding cell division protein ZapB